MPNLKKSLLSLGPLQTLAHKLQSQNKGSPPTTKYENSEVRIEFIEYRGSIIRSTLPEMIKSAKNDREFKTELKSRRLATYVHLIWVTSIVNRKISWPILSRGIVQNFFPSEIQSILVLFLLPLL